MPVLRRIFARLPLQQYHFKAEIIMLFHGQFRGLAFMKSLLERLVLPAELINTNCIKSKPENIRGVIKALYQIAWTLESKKTL